MAAGKKGSGRSGAANLNTMRTLAEDIRKKEFRRVYLLYGSESYLRVQFRCRLRDAMADPKDTMNVTLFSGKSISEKEIIRTADTFPFFADRRVIIVKDSGFFKSQHKELADYIARIPETTCLIFEEETDLPHSSPSRTMPLSGNGCWACFLLQGKRSEALTWNTLFLW